jgi:RNA polymerase sigma-70 factor (ECF subfamily)
MPASDHNLVRRCLGGDTQAFGDLYDRHAVRLHRLLARLTGDATLAEDLTQETFIAAYRSLEAWRGEGAFGSWLNGIGVRLYRKSLRQPHRFETDLPAEETQGGPEADDPFAILSRKESAARLEEAIAALPTPCREAFVLLWVEGMKQREAAALLELPIGTVQSRLWRAVCLLRKRLQESDDAPLREPGGSPQHEQNSIPLPTGNLTGGKEIDHALHKRA